MIKFSLLLFLSTIALTHGTSVFAFKEKRSQPPTATPSFTIQRAAFSNIEITDQGTTKFKQVDFELRCADSRVVLYDQGWQVDYPVDQDVCMQAAASISSVAPCHAVGDVEVAQVSAYGTSRVAMVAAKANHTVCPQSGLAR
jgi:hypothetical protein